MLDAFCAIAPCRGEKGQIEDRSGDVDVKQEAGFAAGGLLGTKVNLGMFS
jgi:hypothetical protein